MGKFAAVGAVVLMAGALWAPVRVSADPAVPAADRMDAAVRLAAGVDTAQPGAKGKVQPLETGKQGRVLVYVSGADVAAARKAVAAAGGAVSDADGDRVRAAVPPAKLQDLASQSGVVEVRRPELPVPLEVTSEGVPPSGAQAWHSAGRRGAGAKVGILDVGFGRLEATQDAGDLPVDVTVNNGQCDPDVQRTHGTTMAEVVHDMAPEAKLYLACVTDSLSFDDAARWLKDQGVQVVNVSMAFPGTGRGSGVADLSAADLSPAAVVGWLRGQGIVVVAAAGNEAAQHMNSGTADPDRDGWLDLPDGSENQSFTVQENGAPITIELRWDAWPRTNIDYDIFIVNSLGQPEDPYTCQPSPDRPLPHCPVAKSIRPQQETPGGLDPVETIEFQNTEAGARYDVYVKIKNPAPPGTRFDLTVYGRVQGVAITNPQGSIAEPASSPYAIAVGAITPAGAAVGGDVEPYSSRGPTIDGRVKPDVIGFTNVSTFTGGPADPARPQGTSVAAAHVTGAAALYKSTNPSLDPAELEGLLLDSSTRPGRNNTFGSGVLNVGQIRELTPPSGSAFTPLPTYRRLIDTSDPNSAHPAPLAAGETLALTVPPSSFGDFPPDATAIMVDVTAVNPASDTDLEVFSDSPTGIPSLSAGSGKTSTALVTATLQPQDKTIKIKNSTSATHIMVDVYGWYSRTSSGSTYFPKTSPYRLLDTRTWGTASPQLDAAEEQVIKVRGVAGVPDTATAVLVDVQASGATETANLELYARTRRGKVTASVLPGEVLQTLTVVPLADDGTIRISAGKSVHVAVDLVGWYATGGGGARYVPMRYAQPLFNSATGNQTVVREFGSAETRGFQVTSQPRVPSNATAVLLDVVQKKGTAVPATSAALWCRECGWWGHTNVAVSPSGQQPGHHISWTLNNPAVVPLGASGVVSAHNAAGGAGAAGALGISGVNISVGLTGYFVGGQSHGSAPLPSPAGHWAFNEGTGTTAGDSSGTGHPATIQGGASWVSGRIGTATMLNGTSGYAATAGSVLHTNQSFTVSSWVYLTRRGKDSTAVAQAGVQQQSAFYLQYSAQTDKWRLSAPSSDTASPPAVASADAPKQANVGEWTHLVGVYDSAAHQLKLYVNGALAGQASATLWDAGGPLMIGAAKNGGTTAGFFGGALDDVRVYSAALSESQVRELHQTAGAVLTEQWKFDEGSGTVAQSPVGAKLSGTLSGGASWEPIGVSGTAVQLNGTSASVEMPSHVIAGTDSFTVTAWAKPINSVNNSCRVVLSQEDATVSDYALQYCGSGAGGWRFGKVGAADLAAGVAAQGPPVALNTWTHLAGVYDADARVLRLYVAGSIVATVDGVTLDNATGAFAVGRGKVSSTKAGFFGGAIDDVRTFQGALSDAQIRDLAAR